MAVADAVVVVVVRSGRRGDVVHGITDSFAGFSIHCPAAAQIVMIFGGGDEGVCVVALFFILQ